MDGQDPDLGKFVLPGFFNANPPGQPQFALTAGDAGLAISIGQAGGEVSVDSFGGINMFTPANGSFMGIDSFGNVSATSGTGGSATVTLTAAGQASIISVDNDTSITLGLDIDIQSRGILLGGGDVNITNAGTIAFDTLGAGAMTGVQTINGAAYPPPGGGGGTSITQADALVACLGNGGVLVSSIGGGVTVDVTNAGTIAFDTLGAGAITGLSTINSSPYIPFTGSLSSISGGGAYVNCVSTIALQTNGDAFLTLEGAETGVPGRITMSGGSSKPEIILNSGGNNIAINNNFSAIPSYLTMDANGVVEFSGAAVNIGNLSTVNGVQFINGGAANLTVSTLTAADYVSTLAVSGVSTISGGTGYLAISAGNTLTLSSTGDEIQMYANSFRLGPNAENHEVFLNGDTHVGGALDATSVSTMTAMVSSITSATDLNINGNTLYLVGGNSAYVRDGGGAGLSVTGAQPTITGSSGLVIDANLSVSTITGVSSINSVAYPPVAAFPKSGIIDNAAVQAATWTTASGSRHQASFALPGITLTSGAVVTVNMYKGSAADAEQYAVLTVNPSNLVAGELTIITAADPSASSIELVWVVYSN